MARAGKILLLMGEIDRGSIDYIDQIPIEELDYLGVETEKGRLQAIEALAGSLLVALERKNYEVAQRKARMIFRTSLLFNKRSVPPSEKGLELFKRQLTKEIYSDTGSPSSLDILPKGKRIIEDKK